MVRLRWKDGDSTFMLTWLLVGYTHTYEAKLLGSFDSLLRLTCRGDQRCRQSSAHFVLQRSEFQLHGLTPSLTVTYPLQTALILSVPPLQKYRTDVQPAVAPKVSFYQMNTPTDLYLARILPGEQFFNAICLGNKLNKRS